MARTAAETLFDQLDHHGGPALSRLFEPHPVRAS